MNKKFFTSILDFFAPNKCYFCRKIGDLACENCLKNQNFQMTISRRKSRNCPSLEFYLGDLEGVLAKILDDLKFNNRLENIEVLAEILSESLLNNDEFLVKKSQIILVPAPTSEKHIRQRGFAHSEQISKIIARKIGVRYSEIIGRKTNATQKGASAKIRKSQASKSYKLDGQIDKNAIYVIVDDVRTTGSTIDSISKTLFESGANAVWAVYLMRQKI